MFRCGVTSLLLAGVCCTNGEREHRAARLAPMTASADAAAPSVKPAAARTASALVREVPFDGGVAHVELDSRGSELVRLIARDGRNLAASTCLPPRAGYDAVRAFYTDVRAAILAGDVERIAAFMSFPLRVNGGRTRSVATREQFVRERSRILTRDVVKRVQDADPGQVFCNGQGDMLGDGVLWAETQANGRLAVWVINQGP